MPSKNYQPTLDHKVGDVWEWKGNTQTITRVMPRTLEVRHQSPDGRFDLTSRCHVQDFEDEKLGRNYYQQKNPDLYRWTKRAATVENTYTDNPESTKGIYIHKTDVSPDAIHSWQYELYEDGRYRTGGRTYQDAAESFFQPRGHGGYNLAYYPSSEDYDTAPFCLCWECARDAFLTEPDENQFWHVESDDGDYKYTSDTVCDVCNTVISPQLCPECGDELDHANHHGPLFTHDHGYILHADCIARNVVKGDATKTGKLTYRVTSQWFAGTLSAA